MWVVSQWKLYKTFFLISFCLVNFSRSIGPLKAQLNSVIIYWLRFCKFSHTICYSLSNRIPNPDPNPIRIFFCRLQQATNHLRKQFYRRREVWRKLFSEINCTNIASFGKFLDQYSVFKFKLVNLDLEISWLSKPSS